MSKTHVQHVHTLNKGICIMSCDITKVYFLPIVRWVVQLGGLYNFPCFSCFTVEYFCVIVCREIIRTHTKDVQTPKTRRKFFDTTTGFQFTKVQNIHALIVQWIQGKRDYIPVTLVLVQKYLIVVASASPFFSSGWWIPYLSFYFHLY